MSDELSRLLELPAVARIGIAGDELALITLSHEHADRVVIERRRLGASIDLHELLGLVGAHGIAEAPRIEISTVPAPELPAPHDDAPVPTARRTRKHPTAKTCVDCERTFANPQALLTHIELERASQDWPCPDCDRVFPSPQALGSHSKFHKNRPKPAAPAPAPAVPAPASSTPDHWTCPQCGKRFNSKVGYDTHVEYAHTPDLPPNAPTTPLRAYTCTACDTPLAGHERCSDCQALLGAGHDAGPAHMEINGKPLCRTCVAYRGTAKTVLRRPS